MNVEAQAGPGVEGHGCDTAYADGRVRARRGLTGDQELILSPQVDEAPDGYCRRVRHDEQLRWSDTRHCRRLGNELMAFEKLELEACLVVRRSDRSGKDQAGQGSICQALKAYLATMHRRPGAAQSRTNEGQPTMSGDVAKDDST